MQLATNIYYNSEPIAYYHNDSDIPEYFINHDGFDPDGILVRPDGITILWSGHLYGFGAIYIEMQNGELPQKYKWVDSIYILKIHASILDKENCNSPEYICTPMVNFIY